MERRLTSKPQARVLMPPADAADVVDVAGIAGAVKRKGNEYFSAVHSPACSDVVADGRGPSGRRSRLSAIAGVGTAASRLSDHPGCDVLSGSEPGSDVVLRHGSPRTAVRTSAGLETDDILELVRLLRDHSSVFTRLEH